MDWSLISLMSLGFVLGLKHSLEPDHVIAVTTLAGQNKSVWRSSLTGVFWGIGHTLTLFIVGAIILVNQGAFPEEMMSWFEAAIGTMLVVLGFQAFLRVRKQLQQKTASGAEGHSQPQGSYRKSLLIGLIHGLAGSAALVLLVLATVQNAWQGALYLLIFGVGSILGMLVFTGLISIPFSLSEGKLKLNHTLIRLAGLLSVGYGIHILYELI